MGLVVLFWSAGFVLKVYGQESKVTGIETDGRLALADGTLISLAKVRVKTPGEEGYESAMFLLSQLLSEKKVWIRKSGGMDYLVWIGCVKNIFGSADCRKGVLVNEELLKVGVVVKQ